MNFHLLSRDGAVATLPFIISVNVVNSHLLSRDGAAVMLPIIIDVR